MNETETRAAYIDPAIKAACWGVVEGSRVRMEFPINKGRLIGHGQRSNPDKADYILQYKNRNLAVIEAKARENYYTEGEQRLLLTLATGTGKTAIAFQIARKLFQAKWTARQAHRPLVKNKNGELDLVPAEMSPRILFLAYRNILADQAFNAFSAFEEDALVVSTQPTSRKKAEYRKTEMCFLPFFKPTCTIKK